jgi:hypothetical protein
LQHRVIYHLSGKAERVRGQARQDDVVRLQPL